MELLLGEQVWNWGLGLGKLEEEVVGDLGDPRS